VLRVGRSEGRGGGKAPSVDKEGGGGGGGGRAAVISASPLVVEPEAYRGAMRGVAP
jgi:hypothetical protein